MSTHVADTPSIYPAVSPCNPLTNAHWQIGPLQFHSLSRELKISGAVVRLTPKAAQVLLQLVQASPETVSRLELLDRVWPGADIHDAILTDAIRTIRRAVRSAGHLQPIIDTIPRSGYRLSEPARQVTGSILTHQTRQQRSSNRPSILRLFSITLCAGMLIAMALSVTDFARTTEHSAATQAAALNPFYERGRELFERHLQADNEEAIRIYQAGLEEIPGDPLLTAALAEAYLQRFDAYQMGGEWGRLGQSLALQAVQDAPHLAATQQAAGMALAIAGNREQARGHFQRAMALQPDNELAITNLAYQALTDRDMDDALALFRRGLEIDPGSSRIHLYIGVCYAELGAHELAEHWFERADKLGLQSPGDHMMHLQMLASLGQTLVPIDRIEKMGGDLDPASRLRFIASINALSGQSEAAGDAYTRLFEIDSVSDRLLSEAASRWLSLEVGESDRDALSQRVQSSMTAVLELGAEGISRPDLLHEVALRLLSLQRFDEAEQWLNRAIDQGWINAQLTRAEPAMRGALQSRPSQFGPLLDRLEQRQQRMRQRLISDAVALQYYPGSSNP